MALRKKVPDAEIPAAAPKQHVTPHQDCKQRVLERDLRPWMAVQPGGQLGRGILEDQEDERAQKAEKERHEVGIVVRTTLNVRKDEGVSNVPYPSPNAYAGRDDDELSEEAVEDEWNQPIMLRADFKKFNIKYISREFVTAMPFGQSQTRGSVVRHS